MTGEKQMSEKDHRSVLLQHPEFALEAAKGDFIMDVTESICAVLEEKNMDRKDLANKMNKSKGYISQLLNGERNMTLETLAEICYALGYTPTITLKRYKEHLEHSNSYEVI